MAADMLWIIINADKQYAIDIQSPFRIILNNDVFLGSSDFYYDKKAFDEKTEKCRTFFPCKITDIFVTKHNDLCIDSEKIRIETFVNSSMTDDELWRIFERHNEDMPHYVAYPDKICEE